MDSSLPDAYATHTINILRVAAGSRQKALDALLTLEGTLVGKVAMAKTLNAQARLASLLEQTQGTIERTYKTIADGHGKDLEGIARLEGKHTKKVINGIIGADVYGVAFSAKTLEAVVDDNIIMGHSSRNWWKEQGAALQRKFAGVMQQGILTGDSNDVLIRKVRGTSANAFNDGIMTASRRDAAALVRSSAIATANAASVKSYEEMGEIVRGIQWLSTLDGKTTTICISLSGLEWRLPDYEPVGHSKGFPGPTAHWNCRSRQIPVLASWEDLSGKKMPELDGKTLEEKTKQKLAQMGMDEGQIAKAVINSRASMDGQVSADLSFAGWLNGKDDGFIDELLGPGRAKLWNRGKGGISLADLTDQNARPLTLAQLDDLIENGNPLPETQGVSYFTMDPAGKFLEVDPEVEVAAAATLAAEAETAAKIKDLATNGTKYEKIAATAALDAGKELNAETLASVQATAAAKKKAYILNQAKNKMLNNEPFTAQQKELLESLDDLETIETIATWQQIKDGWDSALPGIAVKKAAGIDLTSAELKLTEALPDSYKIKLTAAVLKEVEVVKAAEAAAAAAAAVVEKKAKAAALLADLDVVKVATLEGFTPEVVEALKLYATEDPVKQAFFAQMNLAQEQAKKDIVGKLAADGALSGALGSFWGKLAGSVQQDLLAAADSLKDAVAKAKAAFPDPVKPALPNLAPTKVDKLNLLATKLKENKPLTDKQAKLLGNLKPEEEAYLKTLTGGSLADPPKPKPVPAVVPVVIVPRPADIPDGFPKDAASLRVVQKLGGSTGAELVEAPDGKRYVRKKGSSAEHLRAEFEADRAYAAFGIDVPRGAIYGRDGNAPIKLTEFIEGRELGSLSGAEKLAAIEQVKKGFAVDALLGNWDTVGASQDNILFSNGRAVRIDNGGALGFRAQGTKKGADLWNEEPEDIWSMRESAIGKPVFGELTIYDIGRQAMALDPRALDNLDLTPELRATLTARMTNLQKIGQRAVRFERDGFNAAGHEIHARQSVAIRKAGIDSALMQGPHKRIGNTLKDGNGKDWGNLRGGYQSQTFVPAADQDPAYQTIKAAYITVNAHLGKGSPMFNQAKVNEALKMLPFTEKEMLSSNPLEAAEAAYWNDYLKKLDAATNGGTKMAKSPLPIINPYKKPAELNAKTPPAPRTTSVVDDLHVMLKEQLAKKGIGPLAAQDAINEWSAWNGAQAGNSWRDTAQTAKGWMQRQTDRTHWYGTVGKKKIDKNYQALIDRHQGGEETIDLIFHAHHALMQEQLRVLDFDYNDPDAGAILLIRTEAGNLFPGKKVGDTAAIPRGSVESHSVFGATWVHANSGSGFSSHIAVPHSRVLYSYFFERGGGNHHGAFASDHENELVADTSMIPALLQQASGGNNPFASNSKLKDWEKAGVPTAHLK